MSRVFAYLGRFAVIVLGFLAASLAASVFLHLMVLGSAGFRADQTPAIIAGSFIFSIPFTALFVAYLAFLPAMAAIVVAELFAQRSWLFHALAGGLTGLCVVVFLNASAPEPADAAARPLIADPGFVALLVGAGLVAGLAYWLVAGRFSGRWHDVLGAPISPEPSES